MPAYGNVDDVRELARSVLVVEFPDEEILEEQLSAQAKIWTVTKKADWDSNDVQFEYIKKLEIKQAAIYVLEHYNVMDILPILESWQNEINTGLTEIVSSIEDPSLEDVDLEISSKPYQTFPLNPDALISRGRLSLTGFRRGRDSPVDSKYD